MKGFRMFDIKKLLVVSVLFVGGSAVAMEEKKAKDELVIRGVGQVAEKNDENNGVKVDAIFFDKKDANLEKDSKGVITASPFISLKESDFKGEDNTDKAKKMLFNGYIEQNKKMQALTAEVQTKGGSLLNVEKSLKNHKVGEAVVGGISTTLAVVAIGALVADQLCETNYLKKFVTKCYNSLKSVVAKKETVTTTVEEAK